MVAEALQQFAQRNQAHHIFVFFDDHGTDFIADHHRNGIGSGSLWRNRK